MMHMCIAQLLKALADAGLSQREIAQEVGVTQATISRLMAGQQQMRAVTADGIRTLAARRGIKGARAA